MTDELMWTDPLGLLPHQLFPEGNWIDITDDFVNEGMVATQLGLDLTCLIHSSVFPGVEVSVWGGPDRVPTFATVALTAGVDRWTWRYTFTPAEKALDQAADRIENRIGVLDDLYDRTDSGDDMLRASLSGQIDGLRWALDTIEKVTR